MSQPPISDVERSITHALLHYSIHQINRLIQENAIQLKHLAINNGDAALLNHAFQRKMLLEIKRSNAAAELGISPFN